MKLFKQVKSKIAFYHSLVKRYSDENTLFIYQMGKVGSTTLEESLPFAVHVHAFYLENHTCPVRLRGLAKFGLRSIIYRCEQHLLAYVLRYVFKQRKKTKIITLVRDPHKRNISMFFHDLDAYLYSAHTNCMNTREHPIPTRSQSNSMLTEVFNQEFSHNYPLNWFDNEFLPMTGVDIYQHAFEKNNGYSLIAQGQVDILCIRTDKLTHCTEVIADFIGHEVSMNSVNKAENKWYGDIYKDFLKNYSPTDEYTRNIKKSKFYKHFF